MNLPETYLGGEEQYYIEDEFGRLELQLSSDLKSRTEFITGMCIALRGKELEESGLFKVFDYCFPGLAAGTPHIAPSKPTSMCLIPKSSQSMRFLSRGLRLDLRSLMSCPSICFLIFSWEIWLLKASISATFRQ